MPSYDEIWKNGESENNSPNTFIFMLFQIYFFEAIADYI